MKRTFTRNSSTRISRLLILAMVLALLVGTFTGCMKQDAESGNEVQNPPNLVTDESTDPSDDPAASGDESQPEETGPVSVQNNIATVTADQVNLRASPTASSAVIGSLEKGDQIEIVDEETVYGITWIRCDGGWLCMDLVSLPSDYVAPTTPAEAGDTDEPDEPDETTPEETKSGETSTGNGNKDAIAKGIVTASELNIRSTASTTGDIVGKLATGDRVEILEKDGGWGRIDKGWISLDYVYIDGTTGENSGTGTITGDQLNIRTGPGTTYGTNGTLNKGDTVKILTQIKVGNTTWGCIDKGWISMDYVDMD